MQAGLKPDQVHVAGRFRDYSRVCDEADRTLSGELKLSGELGREVKRYSMPSRKATTRCSTSVVASAS